VGGLCLVGFALAGIYRLPLAGWALRHALADAGATDIVVAVTELSPRHLTVQPLGVSWAGWHVAAERVTLDRPSLFAPSLGRVQVKEMVAALDLTAPRATASLRQAGGSPPPSVASPRMLFETLEVNGRLVLISRGGSQALVVEAAAKAVSRAQCTFETRVTAPGLAAGGDGRIDLAARTGDFTLRNLRLELKPWSAWLTALVPGDASRWTVDGVVTGEAHTDYVRGAVTGNGALRLRDGVMRREAGNLSVRGLAVDLSFSSLSRRGSAGVAIDTHISGPGLIAAGHGEYNAATRSIDFAIPEVRMELDSWSDFVTGLVPADLSGWRVGGTVTMSASGRMVDGALAGSAALHLRNGTLHNEQKNVFLDGIETDVAVPDLARMASAPGESLRLVRAGIGTVTLQGGSASYQIVSPAEVRVTGATVGAFGGKLSLEPFSFNPGTTNYAANVVADGVHIEDVLALFPGAPLKATGVMDGRVPMSYGNAGLQFGQGWIGLKAGQTTLVLFNSAGLLTRSMSPKSPAYATVQRIETGKTPLKVEELRVDLHPAAALEGRSAEIHIVGRPQDADTQLGTVTLDVNVNGPLEELINWGLQTDISLSTGRPGDAETKVEPR
jgi:hypothetical protein